jgi:hypothetical protein
MDNPTAGGLHYECEIATDIAIQGEHNVRLKEKGIVDMKAKNLVSKFGSLMAVVVVLGMLAALPAQAGSGLIKITHSDTPFRGAYQSMPSTTAKAQAIVSQTALSEVQIAVMASSPSQPGARHSVYIHR